ncbi:MAG TPA: hypothetical protein VEF76_11825 [Patescibacteria group bacterium]|nr:hypothetical protein [Patescibacteria group bacterium]
MNKPPLFLFAAALLIAQGLSAPAGAQFDDGLGLYEEAEDDEEEGMAATSVTPGRSQWAREHANDEDHSYGDEGGRDIMDEEQDVPEE